MKTIDKLAKTGQQGSELYLANILDTAAEAIICLDERGHIILFNKMAEHIFGYPASDTLGQPLDLLLPQRFHTSHRHYMAVFAQSPVAVRPMGEQRQALWGRRQNGEEFPIEVSISKFELEGQRIFTAALHDISGRKQLEEQLYNEVQQRLAEQILLHEVGQRLSSSLEPETILRHVAEQLCHAVKATSVFISRYDPAAETATIIAEYISPQACPAEQESVLGVTYELAQVFPEDIKMLQANQPKVRQVDDPELSAQQREHLARYGCRTVLDVPMQIGGHSIAYISVWESRRRREFTAEEIGLCQAIAQQAAISLQNAHFHKQIQHHAEELEQRVAERTGELARETATLATLYRLSQEIVANLELEQVYTTAHEAAGQLMPVDAFVIALLDEVRQEVEDVYLFDQGQRWPNLRYPLGRGLTSSIITTGQSLRLDNSCDESSNQARGVELFGAEGDTCSVLAVPLRRGDKIIGVISAQAYLPYAYSDSHLQLLETLANQTSISIANALLYEQAQQEIVERKQVEAERARLFEKQQRTEKALRRVNAQLRQRVEELAMLNYIAQTVATGVDLQAALGVVAEAIIQHFNAFSSGISLFSRDGSEQSIVAMAAAPPNLPTLSDGAISTVSTQTTQAGSATQSQDHNQFDWLGWVIPLVDELIYTEYISQGKSLVIPDPKSRPYTQAAYESLRKQKLQSLMLIPLQTRGDIIGAIAIATNQEGRVFTGDEIKLAETISTQIAGAIENARLFEQERRQRQIAESLGEVAMSLNRSLDRDTVLTTIMDQLKRVIRYDSGSLFLQEGEELVLAKVTNVAERYIGYRIPLASANPLIQVFKQKQPMIIAEVDADPHWQMIAEDPIQSWMGAPLLIGQKAIGVLTADSFEIGAYTQEDVQILQTFASQAAVAIENAGLYQQAQQAAADEERNRLARNLHDSVTQALFSATLVAEVLPQVWQRDPNKAQQGLEKLSRLTKGALAEMRALLLELRPKALLQARLNDLLGQLSQAVAGQSPLDIRLETEPTPTLPPEVQLTFYRIAQETFNNIVKHADASQLTVKLQLSPPYSLDQTEAWYGWVTLSICDNGQGFDPSHVAPGKLGLTIMRERAQSIGATLNLESRPGGGTEVRLSWQNSEDR